MKIYKKISFPVIFQFFFYCESNINISRFISNYKFQKIYIFFLKKSVFLYRIKQYYKRNPLHKLGKNVRNIFEL